LYSLSIPATDAITQELLQEGVILTSIAMLDFAGAMSIWQRSKLKERVALSLSAGLGSQEERRELIQAVLSYAEAVTGKKFPKGSDEHLNVPPPEYIDTLVDILERIFEHPASAIQVPRFLEVLIYDYIIPRKTIERKDLELFFGDISITAKMSKNIVGFLERAIGFPKDIMGPLMSL
jgi:hypothetical protein